MPYADYDTDPYEDADPDIRRVEKRLRRLEQLTEIGMDLARVLREQVVTVHSAQVGTLRDSFGDKYPAALVDVIAQSPRPLNPAAAFAQISRAVRLTIILEGRNHEVLRALRAGREVSVDVDPRPPAEDRPVSARAAQSVEPPAAPAPRSGDLPESLREILVEAAEFERQDPQDLEAIERALDDYLDAEEACEPPADPALDREANRHVRAVLDLAAAGDRRTREGQRPRDGSRRADGSPGETPSPESRPEYAAFQATPARRPRLE